MSLSSKTEPVAIQGAVSTVFAAAVALLTAFDLWDPTEEQIGALAGVLAALIAAGTAFARSKAYAPATVEQIKVDNAMALGGALDQRAEANKLAQSALAVAAQVGIRPMTPPPAPPPPSQTVQPEQPKPAAFAETAFHPTMGPVGGRSGPGTPGNT